MKRSKLNFIIDALMFILMMGLAGIGFLLEYVLVPGREVSRKYGVNADLYLFGLERNQWGEIHLILAFILLGLLILHIVLHWKAICVIFRSLVAQRGWRKVLTPVFVAVNLFLLTFFLFVEPEFRQFERGYGRGRYDVSSIKTEPAAAKRLLAEKMDETRKTEDMGVTDEIAVKGLQENLESQERGDQQDSGIDQETGQESMRERLDMVRGIYTLSTVAEAYDVPVNHIKQKLGLPESTSSSEKLGRLRNRYGFRMSDVERIIMEYRGGQE